MNFWSHRFSQNTNQYSFFSVLTKPPYVVRGDGNRNFGIKVDIFFKGMNEKDSAKKITKQYPLILCPSLEALSSGKKANLKREKTYTQRKLITISHKDPSVIKGLVKGKQNILTKFWKYLFDVLTMVFLTKSPGKGHSYTSSENVLVAHEMEIFRPKFKNLTISIRFL